MAILANKIEVQIDTVSPYAVTVVFLAGSVHPVTLLDRVRYFGSWGVRKAGKATCTAVASDVEDNELLQSLSLIILNHLKLLRRYS